MTEVPDEDDGMLAMPPTIQAHLWEIGHFYQAGRLDAGDTMTGQGEFATVYAALMLATDGACGADIASLYNAWAHDVMLDFILKGAPTPELLTAAQSAYQEAMK